MVKSHAGLLSVGGSGFMACGYVCTNCGKCRTENKSPNRVCLVCGFELEEGSVFCAACGAAQPLPPGKVAMNPRGELEIRH